MTGYIYAFVKIPKNW